MSRISIPPLEAAAEASKPILNSVQKQFGVVPNMFRILGVSSLALEAYSSHSKTLSKAIDIKTRERIALAVAQVNGCDYCLSAHTYLGTNLAGLNHDEVMLNRTGSSHDTKADAAVRFATNLTRQRGHVDEADVFDLRAAGYSDSELIEIIALVAENCFTNFLNSALQTDIDFPTVLAVEAA